MQSALTVLDVKMQKVLDFKILLNWMKIFVLTIFGFYIPL